VAAGFLVVAVFAGAALVGFGFGFGLAERRADRDGVAEWEAVADADGVAETPGAPPPAPGVRAAMAAAGDSARVPGPVTLAGSIAAPRPNAASNAVTDSPRAVRAGRRGPARCRAGGRCEGAASSVGSSGAYKNCLRGWGEK